MQYARSRNVLFTNTGFRHLWLAELISQIGDRASAVALVALVIHFTHSGFLAGAILAANMVAPLALLPLVSRVVDRIARKRIMVTADLAAVGVALSLLLVQSRTTIWIGLVGVVALAAADAFSTPAALAALPNLVQPEQLGTANALLGSLQGISLALGPLLGGVVAAYVGYGFAFATNAGSFLASAILVHTVRGRFEPKRATSDRTVTVRSREAVAYVLARPTVRAVLVLKTLFALAGGGAFVLLPLFADKVFKTGDFGIGVLMAARGLGALGGPFLLRSVIGRKPSRWLSALGASASAFGFAYLLFAATPTMWLGVPLVVVAHMGGFGLWTMVTYSLQRLVPNALLGRVCALDYAGSTSLMAASMLCTGWIGDVLSPRALMAAEAGLLVLASGAWMLRSRFKEVVPAI